jgi:hypothetical protein
MIRYIYIWSMSGSITSRKYIHKGFKLKRKKSMCLNWREKEHESISEVVSYRISTQSKMRPIKKYHAINLIKYYGNNSSFFVMLRTSIYFDR